MRSSRNFLFTLAATLTLTACGDDNDVTSPTDAQPVLGRTAGWFNGREVTFEYTRQFQCTATTGETSGASTGCILGVAPTTRPMAAELDPSADAPVVYVMVPLFSPAPPAATLHCPTTTCTQHPGKMDLSRVFGASAANADTPPHSHIVGQLAGNLWEIEVVGVTTLAAWNDVVATKSLNRVRQLQAQANSPLTGDIPSNLFLFFDVIDRPFTN
jgi:hypothetical protein